MVAGVYSTVLGNPKWKSLLRVPNQGRKNMRLPHGMMAVAGGIFAVVCSPLSLAQAPPPVILTIDLENQVEYIEDVADPLKFATDPGVTTRLHRLSNCEEPTMLDPVTVPNTRPRRVIYN